MKKTTMKKISAAVLAAGFSTVCLAAQPTPADSQIFAQKNALVNWNVLSSVLGIVSVGANYRVAHSTTVGVLGGVSLYSLSDNDKSKTSVGDSWSLGAQANWAMGGGDVMASGWQFNPYFEYTRVESHASGMSGGVLFLYQWAWTSGMNLQLGVGPAYVRASVFADNEKASAGMILPVVSFNLGYAF